MQKSSLLGVSVGESFAEYTLLSDLKPVAQKRAYLARETIKQSLQQFLAENAEQAPAQAFISLRLPKKLLDFQLAGSVAHITTEGFTHWLNISSVGTRDLTDNELLFSVRERILSDGSIETPLSLEDLEAISEKMLAANCKKACLHFLHSAVNPQHVEQAQAFLLSKNIESFIPEKSDTPNEVTRWNKNALSATVSSIFEERTKEVLSALENTFAKNQIHFLDSAGQLSNEENPQNVGRMFASFTAMGLSLGGTEKADILYLGLENFLLISGTEWKQTWESPWGPVETPHLKTKELGLQPTSGIAFNTFGRFDFTSSQEGWEPGPMFMGRGQKLCLLDLWAENSKLTKIAGLEDRVVPQGIQRFKNSLFTLSKISKTKDSEVSSLTKEMQSLALQRLAIEAVLQRQRKKMIVTGPLAPVFANVFKKDPYAVVDNQEFCESYATALWGAKALQETL